MATNLKEDKVMMGFSIAFIIIVLIVLYSLARTAGESDRILENIREQSLLGREEELWWEQLKKEISIRNAGLYLQKKSLKEN